MHVGSLGCDRRHLAALPRLWGRGRAQASTHRRVSAHGVGSESVRQPLVSRAVKWGHSVRRWAASAGKHSKKGKGERVKGQSGHVVERSDLPLFEHSRIEASALKYQLECCILIRIGVGFFLCAEPAHSHITCPHTCFSISAICWRCCDGGVISAPRMMSRISLCVSACARAPSARTLYMRAQRRQAASGAAAVAADRPRRALPARCACCCYMTRRHQACTCPL